MDLDEAIRPPVRQNSSQTLVPWTISQVVEELGI